MQILPSNGGTSYKQGHLDASYDQICKVLGKPNHPDDDGKVQYSWSYTVDGEQVSIWDYKGVRWSYYGKREVLAKLFGEGAVKSY